jgi:hypothetical protein
MAITATKSLKQSGKFFTCYGEVVSGAAADDQTTIIDFDTDLNPTQYGKTYTSFKIVTLHLINHSQTSAGGKFTFSWDADTDRVIAGVSRGAMAQLDFKDFLEGGLPHSQTGGYNGDIVCDLVADTATDDRLSFFMYGELSG